MATSLQTRTYQPAEVVSFRLTKERFGGLSNMASGFPVEVNGVQIATSEALYQACRFPDRPDAQRSIIEQRSPMTAKMKGRRYLQDTRPDWERIRVDVMRWCLRVKLAQNWDSFGKLLLSTGDSPIVEDSRRDAFWGAKRGDEGLIGTNALGRLLMELREELKEPDQERLRVVEPPPIPNFLLYGQPITQVAFPDSHATQQDIDAGIKTAGSGISQPDMGLRPSPTKAHSPLGEGQEIEMQHHPNGQMIPKECKRLAEVDFPIAEVSRHAVRENSVRQGHPRALHLWWAQRPLASSRAVLLALLLPDPCDPHCPESFKRDARTALLAMRERPSGWDKQIATDEGLRRAILRFIADFANWDNAAKEDYLTAGRALVRAAHPGDDPPLVVDPFAGGGSIPLEALRLGCDAFASDLNPVACLILKAMLEDIPRHGAGLADELRQAGAEIKAKAEAELADLYPKEPDEATPIAYLWARTVRCEAPNCGVEIPLLRSLWLCKKANRKRALRPKVMRAGDASPRVEFEIFEPESEREVANGTVARAKATCLCCGAVLPPDRVRAQLFDQRGGADATFDARGNRTGGARLTAVVTLRPGEQGRHYRLPTVADYAAVHRAQGRIERILNEWDHNERRGHCPVPDEPLPPVGTLGFRVQRYGMLQWGDLFTARQKVAFTFLTKAIATGSSIEAVKELLAIVCTKLSDRCNGLVNWSIGVECPNQLFKGNAIPMGWDFSESNILSNSSASIVQTVENTARNVEATVIDGAQAQAIQQADAATHPLSDQAAGVCFTDPPYYNAIPYADLSDFFFVWLKRALPSHPFLRDPFDLGNPLSPKNSEAVQDETKLHEGTRKDRKWFEETVAKCFAEGRRVLYEEGIGSVVFAHKTTEGWEALLSGMIRGGWTITGSWPIATERYSRLRARDSAALATSVHLVCRPRLEHAPVGDWGDVLRELPDRVGVWMQRLEGEGVRGADLVFACVGPALEIFSRYSHVETADGRAVGLAEYLEKVWEVVGREALQQVLGTAEAQARNGMAGALEEDARLTALFLWTMRSTGDDAPSDTVTANEDVEADEEDETPRRKAAGHSLPFDVVRRFAQPLGIHLDDWEKRIVDTQKGVVRLVPVRERAKSLFGESGADTLADRIESDASASLQLSLFPEAPPNIRGRARRRGRPSAEPAGELDATRAATTLDRVHAAMLFQASGRTEALRAHLRSEQERGPDFQRLANALSALYPRGSEEKRLLDAMLLAMPR